MSWSWSSLNCSICGCSLLSGETYLSSSVTSLPPSFPVSERDDVHQWDCFAWDQQGSWHFLPPGLSVFVNTFICVSHNASQFRLNNRLNHYKCVLWSWWGWMQLNLTEWKTQVALWWSETNGLVSIQFLDKLSAFQHFYGKGSRFVRLASIYGCESFVSARAWKPRVKYHGHLRRCSVIPRLTWEINCIHCDSSPTL